MVKPVSNVWADTQADLALFYIPLPRGLGEIGERWDKSSYLQALGFLILVFGTLVYGRGDEELEKQEVRRGSDSHYKGSKTKKDLDGLHLIYYRILNGGLV